MKAVQQGGLELLQHPASQELLHSKIPARLAYVWPDGTPRVVPIWFHWNGHEIVMASPPKAPKLKALRTNPKVSRTLTRTTSRTKCCSSAEPPASKTSTASFRNTRPPQPATSTRQWLKAGSPNFANRFPAWSASR